MRTRGAGPPLSYHRRKERHASHRSRHLAGRIGPTPVIALTAAACGTTGGGAAAAPPPSRTANGQSATVSAANAGLGQILVNAQGRTLYLFQKDTGTTSACTGACAAAWPPLRATGQPVAGTGANGALLKTTPRSDGASQSRTTATPSIYSSRTRAPATPMAKARTRSVLVGSCCLRLATRSPLRLRAAPAPEAEVRTRRTSTPAGVCRRLPPCDASADNHRA